MQLVDVDVYMAYTASCASIAQLFMALMPSLHVRNSLLLAQAFTLFL